MASLQFDPAAGVFRIRFRFRGRAFFRSLHTGSEREAQARLGAAEKTIRAIEDGYLSLPAGVEPGDFILSDGRIDSAPETELPREAAGPLTLGTLFDVYERELTPGAKEANTLDTERTHRRHLVAHLGADTRVAALDHKQIQDYVNARAGAAMAAKTVRMELATLRMLWNWALANGQLTAPLPWVAKRLTFPKGTPKEPFQTWAQIERRIEAGRRQKGWGLGQESRLWESLYLDESQVVAVLGHVREHAAHPFVHPMFAFCAYTGARRSEILRSEREDWDLAGGTVAIRQKKSDTSRTHTLRHVPVHPALAEVMRDWFRRHPGGPYAICTANRKPIGPRMATKYFHAALAGSKWSVVPGFHCFRHSMASIMASKGIDQRLINDILGHSTEDMVRRYRHLFPQRKEQAVAQLFA